MSPYSPFWIQERLRDIVLWPLNLVRDLPRRSRWLLTALQADGSVPGVPTPRRRHRALGRLHRVLIALFDLLGGPELAQALMHLGMNTLPLRPDEIAAVSSVLGDRAIRYQDVRLASGGILRLVFRLNGGRAFATWHTVHLPESGWRRRENLSLLIHELVHVYQYEKVGSRYIGEALFAQRRLGRQAYRYGSREGLRKIAASSHHPYKEFNREAQAQIAQDYFSAWQQGADVTEFGPFLRDLRAGVF